jgi:hypothetical protein
VQEPKQTQNSLPESHLAALQLVVPLLQDNQQDIFSLLSASKAFAEPVHASVAGTMDVTLDRNPSQQQQQQHAASTQLHIFGCWAKHHVCLLRSLHIAAGAGCSSSCNSPAAAAPLQQALQAAAAARPPVLHLQSLTDFTGCRFLAHLPSDKLSQLTIDMDEYGMCLACRQVHCYTEPVAAERAAEIGQQLARLTGLQSLTMHTWRRGADVFVAGG